MVYRSVSYTRGTAVESATTYDPLNRGMSLSSDQNNSQGVVGLQQQGSLVLGQYRRHAASMSAAPIRGSNFESKPIRSSSWAPDSPKKTKAYKPLTGGQTSGIWFRLFGKLEESKYFNQKILKHNKKEFFSWILLGCLVLLGYKFFSDGSFSAVLTLASAFQCFSLALMMMKVLVQQSIIGISIRSLLLITLSLIARLCSTLFYNGYLPVDRSGDWVYQGADIMSVFVTLALILYARRFCQLSIQQQQEKDTCVVVAPICVAFVLAVLIHPTLNQHTLADISWTFALYVETFAMVPQLFLMAKLGGEVEALTSHFVASMGASKVFAFLFWYFSYAELAPRHGGRNIAGWAVILAYSTQTLLFVDFFYYYICSMKVGRKMIINF